MKRVLLVTAALVAAVALWIALSLPAAPLDLDTSWDDGTVAGAFHIHTLRSDGSGTPDAIAAAAARAGLKFVIFTDHGDGTRAPDPPAYLHGVLCIDGVEVSTTGGHYAVLDLGAAPYPLGGEPRDVVEDVRRLGGFGIVSHPDSPKRELNWPDWSLAVDALELVNLDTAWRVQRGQRGWGGKWRLLGALASYPFRPAATVGNLLTPSEHARARWTQLTGDWPTVAIGAVDAHARIELSSNGRLALPFPSYESSFRTLTVHVTPTGPLSGDPVVDGARVVAGIRRGQVYTAVDAWAGPPRLRFTATSAEGTVGPGSVIAPSRSPRLNVEHNGASDFVTTIYNGLEAVASGGNRITLDAVSKPGAYHVEVRDPRHVDGPPWMTSNAIYLHEPFVPAATAPTRGIPDRTADRVDLFDGRTTSGWTIEMDPSSLAAVDVVPTLTARELRVRYGLSGGAVAGQFAGVAVDTLSGAGGHDRLSFTIRGERPMRVSVQARVHVNGRQAERWQRSIYVDDTERSLSVFFADMTPVGQTQTSRPPSVNIRNLMFIVDTTNTRPGASGNLWLKDVRLERSTADRSTARGR